MKRLVLYHLLIGAFGTALVYTLLGFSRAASFGSGVLLVAVNLALHILIWGFFVRKKLIAFAATIIVFKYGILAAVIYKILKLDWSEPAWFCFGVSTLVLAAVVVAISRKEHVI